MFCGNMSTWSDFFFVNIVVVSLHSACIFLCLAGRFVLITFGAVVLSGF